MLKNYITGLFNYVHLKPEIHRPVTVQGKKSKQRSGPCRVDRKGK
jgi:hypothetical protein